ncbi:hybrid sensor histidine kinase/response regulator [Roseobacter sinensis]|uniref:histidine kinase n=1 Tax=Roseobacter sinensis TaxID=2931391 RepID=A0ABT3BET5_9RHOB|nr:ATP-binding protein [Roseobacter sp. WL0113]MCV3272089.1 PAS domain-containing protein [Roseobacter sp. WL0113]
MSELHYLESELEQLIQADPAIWKFIREASLDGVWYWDLDHPEHEYMSPEFWRLFGFDPDDKDHLASEWQDLIYPEDLELAKTNLAAHLADPDHPYDQVVRYKCANGETAWVRCRGIAVRDKDGQAIRLLGAHNDITALKREERAAKNNSEFLSQIMNTARSAIIGLSAHGQVTSINSAGRHFLGGISDDVPFDWPDEIGFLETASLQPLENSHNPILRILAGATLKEEVFLLTRNDSKDPRYVRVSSSPVEISGESLLSVIILDDVSEQERNRQQIERTSRLDALGQLTGGIAHDFNNLLATVQYALQLAQDAGSEMRRTHYLDTALSSISRGSDLTKRLLAFAKQQPGKAVSQAVSEIMDDFRRLANPLIERNVALDFQVSDADLWVYCDTAQLSNALLNLLLNARDAIQRSARGNRITIRARGIDEIDADVTLRREHPGTYIAKGLYEEHSQDRERKDNAAYRYIEFAVTDNGPGMPDEVKRRAIDPFFTTKDTNSGTGLGLSMVYGFVQQANGELRIYSEPDQGTTVRLLVPRGTSQGQREEPVERLPETHGSGERILVVEDEFSLRMMMEDLITSLGYSIETAQSGSNALAMIERGETFDLVLTDIVMPGDIGGFVLAKKVRELLPEIPIIYMSGYTGYSEDDMIDVVAPILQKPCPPAELAKTISDALRAQK